MERDRGRRGTWSRGHPVLRHIDTRLQPSERLLSPHLGFFNVLCPLAAPKPLVGSTAFSSVQPTSFTMCLIISGNSVPNELMHGWTFKCLLRLKSLNKALGDWWKGIKIPSDRWSNSPASSWICAEKGSFEDEWREIWYWLVRGRSSLREIPPPILGTCLRLLFWCTDYGGSKAGVTGHGGRSACLVSSSPKQPYAEMPQAPALRMGNETWRQWLLITVIVGCRQMTTVTACPHCGPRVPLGKHILTDLGTDPSCRLLGDEWWWGQGEMRKDRGECLWACLMGMLHLKGWPLCCFWYGQSYA